MFNDFALVLTHISLMIMLIIRDGGDDATLNLYLCRYRKGKEVSQGGTTKFTLDDPYSVFQNVANTPGYHKKGKMEMIARLDNFGPFHVFFTVSCADYKWSENLISGIPDLCIPDLYVLL